MADAHARRVALTPTKERVVLARILAPRVLGLTAVLLLALAGLRAAVWPTRPRVERIAVPSPAPDPAAQDAFAEGFARAYLTFDANDPTAHDRAVDSYLAPGTELDGTVQPASGGRQHVVWTATAGHGNDPPANHRVVLVAVGLDGQSALRYLAVPVVSGAGGTLAVDAPPALVAPPPRGNDPPPGPGDPVADDTLHAVVVRGLAAYLRGAAGDLAADLLPGAYATVPTAALTLQDVQDLTWAGPDAVGVLATVRDDAASYELRYRVGVARRERWFITAIDPTNPGGTS